MSAAQERTPVEVVLERLHAAGSRVRQSRAGQWEASCPNGVRHKNGDKRPSLGLGEGPNGTALVYCQSGCSLVEVADALGLSLRDLFPKRQVYDMPKGSKHLKAVYPYFDETGEKVYEVCRYLLSDGTKSFGVRVEKEGGGFTYSAAGVKRVLYHLPQVIRAVDEGREVWIVEGEKDAENLQWELRDTNAVTTCNAFGAIKSNHGKDGEWLAQFAQHLKDAAVTIIADDDAAGRLHADLIAITLRGVAKSVRVLLPAEGHKDISEHLGAGKRLDDLRPIDAGDVEDDDEWEAIAMWGGDALMSVDDAPEARWGEGDRVLWATGESLLIAGRTGVGKTTLALSVLAGLVGLESEALGLPIRPAKRVLYLAMDRPRQIMRSMRRRFQTAEDLAVLNQTLVIRKGPMLADLLRQPEQLLELARRYGCDVVIVDSLKDAAAKLTDDEVGSQVNRAVQMCNAVDVDVLVLHHQRKGDVTQRKDDEAEPSVEDVFGSNWITAGAGSVIILAGQPGAEIVKLWHVKQPAEPLGPWLVEHDHHAGRSSIVHSFNLAAYLKHRGRMGCTAVEAAKAEHQKEVKSSGREAARSKRLLDALVRRGQARREADGRSADGTQAAIKWFWIDPLDDLGPVDNPRDGSRDDRDGDRDGWVPEDSVAEPCQAVTDSEKDQVTTVTPTVTDRDAPATVTGWGGYITPNHHGAPLNDPDTDVETPFDDGPIEMF